MKLHKGLKVSPGKKASRIAYAMAAVDFNFYKMGSKALREKDEKKLDDMLQEYKELEGNGSKMFDIAYKAGLILKEKIKEYKASK